MAELNIKARLDDSDIKEKLSKIGTGLQNQMSDNIGKALNQQVKNIEKASVKTLISDAATKSLSQATEALDKLEGDSKTAAVAIAELKTKTKELSIAKADLTKQFYSGSISSDKYSTSLAAIEREQKSASVTLQVLNHAVKQSIQLEKAAIGSLEEARVKYSQLTQAIVKAGGAMDGSNPSVSKMISEHQKLRGEIDSMEHKMGMYQRNVGNYASGWNGIQNSINQMSRELPAFTHSFQTGMLALSNQWGVLADDIKRAKDTNKALTAEGKQGVPVWKQLASALFSWQTLMSIGVTLTTVYGKEIGEWIKKLLTGKKAIDGLKESQEALNNSFKSNEYTSAVESISKLQSAVKLAKDGFVSKKSVVEEYNKTIGQTTGEVKTLDEVEKFLVKGADDYIKMTLYKAAANLQLAEAAKKAVQIQENSMKKSEDFVGFMDRGLLSMLSSGGEFSQGAITAEQAEQEAARRGEIEKKNVQKRLKAEQDAYEKNANELLKIAAKSANSLSISLFGESVDKKAPKPKTDTTQKEYESLFEGRKRVLERIADLDRDFARKDLSANDSEIQAIKDKFTELRRVIDEENEEIRKYNVKNKKKPLELIDTSELNSKEDLYIGQAKLRQEEEAQKIYQELLKGYENYQQKLARIEADFEAERVKLGKGITEEQKRIWQERKDAEIEQLQETEAEKNRVLNQGAKQYLLVTTANIVAQIKVVKDLLSREDIGENMRSQLESNLSKLQSNLKLGATAANLTTLKSKIADLQKELVRLSKTPGTNPAEIKRVNAELIKTQEEVDELTNKKLADLHQILQLVGQNLNELGAAFSNMGDAFNSDILSSVGDALSGIAFNLDNISVAFDKNATSADKYAAGAQSLVSIMSMIGNASADRRRAEEEYYRSVIQMQNEYNLSKAEQLRLESELGESLYVKNYVGRVQDGMKSAEYAIGKYRDSIKELTEKGKISKGLENAIDWKNVGSGAALGGVIGSVVPVIGNLVGAAVGAIVGGLVGLFGGKKKKPKYEDLYGSLPKELVDKLQSAEPQDLTEVKALLQSLNNDKAVDANTKQMLEGTLKWIEQIEKAREQVREVVQELSGSLGNELRNKLVEAFKAGEDAAKAMGKTVDKVIEDMLSQLLFSKAFDKVFKDLETKLTDTLVFGDDTDIIDVFSEFLDKAGAAGDNFYKLMEAAKKAGLENGMNIFSKDNESGSQGTLSRGLTSTTESETINIEGNLINRFKIAI